MLRHRWGTLSIRRTRAPEMIGVNLVGLRVRCELACHRWDRSRCWDDHHVTYLGRLTLAVEERRGLVLVRVGQRWNQQRVARRHGDRRLCRRNDIVVRGDRLLCEREMAMMGREELRLKQQAVDARCAEPGIGVNA